MSRSRCTVASLALAIALVVIPSPLLAQAVWSGGDGNWASDHWTGGTGPNGQPGGGQNVLFPASTGIVTLDTNVAGAVGSFNEFNQQAGTLVIRPGGRASFAGDVRIADGPGSFGDLLLAGQLEVGGGLNVGYGQGDTIGNAAGLLAVEGAASLTVGGTLDTWWDPGSHFSVTGGQADIQVMGDFLLGPEAAMSVNLNDDTFSTVHVAGNLNFAGGSGSLNVNFIQDYFPAIGTSWTLFDASMVGGEIPVLNFPATPNGTLLTVEQVEGGEHGRLVTLNYINTLHLRIDPQTGEGHIENPAVGGQPLEIDGYIIRSPSESLNSAGFVGVGQPGWLPGLPPSQSNGLLSETSLQGSLTVSPGDSIPIGSIFQSTGTNDLEFEFRLVSGGTLTGTIQLDTGGLIGDFNGNGVLDAGDIDDLTTQSAGGAHPPEYDLTNDALVNADDVSAWIHDAFQSWIGDANLDGQFTSSDLVNVLASGTYETNVAAVWSTGDFNGDGRTTSSDLVAALADGGYEAGPRAAVAAVPEPASAVLVLLAIALFGARLSAARQSLR